MNVEGTIVEPSVISAAQDNIVDVLFYQERYDFFRRPGTTKFSDKLMENITRLAGSHFPKGFADGGDGSAAHAGLALLKES